MSPDGARLALGLTGEVERFVVFDATNCAELATIPTEGCGAEAQSIPWGWSPDGSKFVVSGDCARDDTTGGNWVEILDGDTFAPLTVIDRAGADIAWASFDSSGRLYLFAEDADVAIHGPTDYSGSTTLDGVRGRGDVSADSSTIVTLDRSTDELRSYDAATGESIDRLTPLPATPNSHGVAFGFSPSGDLFAAPTRSERTLVWDMTTSSYTSATNNVVPVPRATISKHLTDDEIKELAAAIGGPTATPDA